MLCTLFNLSTAIYEKFLPIEKLFPDIFPRHNMIEFPVHKLLDLF